MNPLPGSLSVAGNVLRRSSSATRWRRAALSAWSRVSTAAVSAARVCRQRAMRQRGEQTRCGRRPVRGWPQTAHRPAAGGVRTSGGGMSGMGPGGDPASAPVRHERPHLHVTAQAGVQASICMLLGADEVEPEQVEPCAVERHGIVPPGVKSPGPRKTARGWSASKLPSVMTSVSRATSDAWRSASRGSRRCTRICPISTTSHGGSAAARW
jgi:hypothetical protein